MLDSDCCPKHVGLSKHIVKKSIAVLFSRAAYATWIQTAKQCPPAGILRFMAHMALTSISLHFILIHMPGFHAVGSPKSGHEAPFAAPIKIPVHPISHTNGKKLQGPI